MPDKRVHRGPHPKDRELFSAKVVPGLQMALQDYSLLLTKGYAQKSSLKLVGDKFSLTERQRLAIMRNTCSDQQLENRLKKQIKTQELSSQVIVIDGYNVLITIEAAISGAVIFKGRDGCYRDLASIHGTYRKVAETLPAVILIGEFLKEIGISQATWLIDSPVSNSGRLKALISESASKAGWYWDVKLVTSPDAELRQTQSAVATSDSIILDQCSKWVNLAREIIYRQIPDAWIIDLAW